MPREINTKGKYMILYISSISCFGAGKLEPILTRRTKNHVFKFAPVLGWALGRTYRGKRISAWNIIYGGQTKIPPISTMKINFNVKLTSV